MANRPIFWIAFCVFVCNKFACVEANVKSASTCRTHADCQGNWLYKYCCGGKSKSIDRATRVCGFYKCLDKYCETESHCGDPTLCCHSNICVDRGCYGCTTDSDCSYGHVCCKKSFRLNQAFCAKDCVGQQCNNNDDCAVGVECCRDGKCTHTRSQRCSKQCKSNSECDLGKYCCKKKSVWFWQDRCIETCVDEDCISDDDCGPPNECCIARKCAKEGCSECASDSDCTSGRYCCKKGYPNKAKKCLADCTRKSCATTSDCDDPHEICNSNYICARRETKQNHKDSFPKWHIALIIVGALLIAFCVPIVIFWCYKRKGANNTTQGDRASSQNIQSQGSGIMNAQPNTQFAGFNYNNPIQQQGTGFGLVPSSNQQQQNKQNRVSPNPAPLDNDGYVNPLYSPTDEACQDPDVALIVG